VISRAPRILTAVSCSTRFFGQKSSTKDAQRKNRRVSPSLLDLSGGRELDVFIPDSDRASSLIGLFPQKSFTLSSWEPSVQQKCSPRASAKAHSTEGPRRVRGPPVRQAWPKGPDGAPTDRLRWHPDTQPRRHPRTGVVRRPRTGPRPGENPTKPARAGTGSSSGESDRWPAEGGTPLGPSYPTRLAGSVPYLILVRSSKTGMFARARPKRYPRARERTALVGCQRLGRARCGRRAHSASMVRCYASQIDGHRAPPAVGRGKCWSPDFFGRAKIRAVRGGGAVFLAYDRGRRDDQPGSPSARQRLGDRRSTTAFMMLAESGMVMLGPHAASPPPPVTCSSGIEDEWCRFGRLRDDRDAPGSRARGNRGRRCKYFLDRGDVSATGSSSTAWCADLRPPRGQSSITSWPGPGSCAGWSTTQKTPGLDDRRRLHSLIVAFGVKRSRGFAGSPTCWGAGCP